ncbi:odorant receptor 4-like [Schistocerca serialis cubense]|uniref:odorant receptor 4-like n=1 Tax=Schistocerca serialis cubense TaxID=2023355 RepID=UPI00214EDBA7|nr:odorant receptor 4-like [Schistocerca serialis cubense]
MDGAVAPTLAKAYGYAPPWITTRRLYTDLSMQQRALRVAGVWVPPGGKWSLAYGAYSAFVMLSVVTFLASQLSAMLHFWGDILSVTTNACVTFTFGMAIFKFTVFLKMRPLTNKLIEELDSCLERYGRTYARQKATIFGACALRGRRVCQWQLCLALSVYAVWEVLPLLQMRTCSSTECRVQSGFPALVWYPFSFTEAPLYQVVYIVVSTGLFYGCFVSNTLVGVFCSLMINVSGHVRFLNVMARNMGYVEKCGKGGNCHSCRYASTSTDTEKEMRRRLKECVRYHNDIARLIERLSALVGPILLGEFLADVITVSVSAFVTTTVKADSGWLFKYASYLSAIAEQMFLYCWFGDEILSESERLQVSAYSCDWTGGSPRFLRELRIFLCRTGRPLMLTASKFYTITRETFLLLINASYSYFALLNQLNSE